MDIPLGVLFIALRNDCESAWYVLEILRFGALTLSLKRAPRCFMRIPVFAAESTLDTIARYFLIDRVLKNLSGVTSAPAFVSRW